MANKQKKIPLPKSFRKAKADQIRLQVLNPDGDPEVFYDFEHITPRKRYRCQTFVHEYVKDFCGANAVRRMGIDAVQPAKIANDILNEPFTQWYLAGFIKKLDEKSLVQRNDVLAGLLKEANANNSVFANSSTRINALKALAKILGMEITKIEGTISQNGGVMAIPVANSLEDWERMATQSQAGLKEDVKR